MGTPVVLERRSPAAPRARRMALADSGWYFGALFLTAVVAFWPSYLSQPRATYSVYTHVHAATATLWMLLLISQPMAVRAGRLAMHRATGKASYVVAPVVLLSMVLLANSRIRGATPEAYPIQVYVLYLQISLAALFALCYGLGVAWRRDTGLHARFMTCTGLTLIDPVVVRLLIWMDPSAAWNYQWLTFGLTDLVLVVLIWQEGRRPAPRKVFHAMLPLFVVAQLPALIGLTGHPVWQGFARWFRDLPLT